MRIPLIRHIDWGVRVALDPKLGIAQAASNFVSTKCHQGGVVGFFGVGKPRSPGYTEAIGTGILLNIAGEVYCITARHVLEPEVQVVGRVGYSFSCGRTGERPLRVQDGQIRQALSNHRDDLITFKLAPEQKNELEVVGQLRPFELSDLGLRERPATINGGLFIAGFPEAVSFTDEAKRRVDSSLLVYLTAESEKPCTSYSGYLSHRDFKVHYQLEGNVGNDGQTVVSPWPQGASGGPLWIYWEEDRSGIRVPMAKIIGICRRFEDVDNLIIVTDIKVALECMAGWWSALETVFDGLEVDWRPPEGQ